MAYTLADIATRLGVSPSTVSRALSGSPGMSESTRKRVVAAAEELGFTRDRAAQNLATGKTGAIGVIVPYVTTWFFSQAISGLEKVFRTADYDLLLYNLGDEQGRARLFERMPLRKRVDGVMVLALPMSEAEVASLASLDVPLAMVGARASGFGSVTIDDAVSARTAIRHLTSLGHRRIGVLAGEPVTPMRFTSVADRLVGVRQALAEVSETDASYAYTDLSVEGGELGIAELMSLPQPPTAVFAMSDEMAFGAIRTLRRMGLSVPRDVSVIGFDDHSSSELFDLTTIRQPVVEQGMRGAELLLDAVRERHETTPVEVTLPTSLVVRSTTAPPAAVDPPS